jgi:hypothetical protein
MAERNPNETSPHNQPIRQPRSGDEPQQRPGKQGDEPGQKGDQSKPARSNPEVDSPSPAIEREDPESIRDRDVINNA